MRAKASPSFFSKKRAKDIKLLPVWQTEKVGVVSNQITCLKLEVQRKFLQLLPFFSS